MTNKQFLNKLKKAKLCCNVCGNNFGERTRTQSTWYDGKCDVCGVNISVTEVRDFNYLRNRIKELEKELKKELKLKEKKIKERIKKSESPAKLWKKVSVALQDYYRMLNLTCWVCGDKQQVMHHFIPWGRSTFLRLSKDNLVPLCNKCHCKFHAGDMETSYLIRKAGSLIDVKWEENLIQKSHISLGLKGNNLSEYLKMKIEYYENLRIQLL